MRLEDLCALLRCPRCRAALAPSAGGLACATGHDFPVVDGVPVLADPGADEHKRRQADFFDAEDPAWEVGRPHGAPRLYGWLMAEKARRSVLGLEDRLPGATALTVCGGSGMDAEFLARAGATVIASDLSLGAARRAAERGRRHGLAIAGLVADAEDLPLRDGAVDLAYVHDGLHHLTDPIAAAREMARVAGHAVSVSEPAAAAVTRLAVRFGVAEATEEAGNPVERLTPAGLEAALRDAGFDVVGAERYAMFYRHVPGAPGRFFSRRRTFPVARAAIRGFNAVLGGAGNKLSVRAVRRQAVATMR